MKSGFLKALNFLYHILGVTVWKITTVRTKTEVSVSKLACVMSVVNLCAVALARHFISYELDQRMSLSPFHNSFLVELGDELLKLTFMARYYIIYASVWFFYRRQKALINCFLDVNQRLKKIESLCCGGGGNDINQCKNQLKRSAYVRLFLFAFVAWNVPVNMVIQAVRGCNYYADSLRDFRVMIVTLLVICGNWSALFGILCSPLLAEIHFEQIRFWLKTLRNRKETTDEVSQKPSSSEEKLI